MMGDFFSRLVQRSDGVLPVVAPRLSSRFEAAPAEAPVAAADAAAIVPGALSTAAGDGSPSPPAARVATGTPTPNSRGLPPESAPVMVWPGHRSQAEAAPLGDPGSMTDQPAAAAGDDQAASPFPALLVPDLPATAAPQRLAASVLAPANAAPGAKEIHLADPEPLASAQPTAAPSAEGTPLSAAMVDRRTRPTDLKPPAKAEPAASPPGRQARGRSNTSLPGEEPLATLPQAEGAQRVGALARQPGTRPATEREPAVSGERPASSERPVPAPAMRQARQQTPVAPPIQVRIGSIEVRTPPAAAPTVPAPPPAPGNPLPARPRSALMPLQEYLNGRGGRRR